MNSLRRETWNCLIYKEAFSVCMSIGLFINSGISNHDHVAIIFR